MDMPLACFKSVDTLLIAIETRRRHVPTLWRFFQFTLLCDGERDFFELEVEVV